MKRMDEQAVSPVIAVILMVAITVVLAGVLYVWVSGLADTGDDTVEIIPLEAKDAEQNVDDVMFYLKHSGGDPLDLREYRLLVGPEGDECEIALTTDIRSLPGSYNSTWDNATKTLSVNNRVYLSPSCLAADAVNNGDRINMVLINKDSETRVWEKEITVYDA